VNNEYKVNNEHKVNDELWTNLEERPQLQSVMIGGVELRSGNRVRLWPLKRADIMDLALVGKTATIEAIEQDYEGQVHLAVVIDDDPGRDLGLLRQVGHRFFFSTREVEPIVAGNAAGNDRHSAGSEL
jgi:hypothetical protein